MRYVLMVLLLGAAFFGGVAWKSSENKTDSTQLEETSETGSTPGSTSSTNEAAVPTSLNSKLTTAEQANIRLFERSRPSVCFITTSTLQQSFFSRDITEIPRGTGSGFVWDNEGHIVTNFHVIKGADRATVTLSDQSVWDAELVGIAPEKDLAVLKIDAPRSTLRPIPVGQSDVLRVGQNVYAIGNPFGLDQTLTTGIVSALGREIESQAGIPIRDVIQTDAAINPGNSGGPLLNSSGELIGVNTAIYSPSGASAGIGFSIPVDAVSWVVPELIEFGKIRRPTLGVNLADQRFLENNGLEGALIINVTPGSTAEKSGIRPTRRDDYGRIQLGDIIIGFNKEKIKTNGDLILALEKYDPGDVVELTVLRGDKKVVIELPLDESN